MCKVSKLIPTGGHFSAHFVWIFCLIFFIQDWNLLLVQKAGKRSIALSSHHPCSSLCGFLARKEGQNHHYYAILLSVAIWLLTAQFRYLKKSRIFFGLAFKMRMSASSQPNRILLRCDKVKEFSPRFITHCQPFGMVSFHDYCKAKFHKFFYT